MRALIFVEWPVKAWSIPDTHAERLALVEPDVEFARARTLEEAGQLLRDVDIAFTPHLKAEFIGAAPRLAWVHSPAAAVEGLLPLHALDAAAVLVTNSKGIQDVPIAEHVMGGLLTLSRRFNRTLDAQRERTWIQNDLVDDWPWLLSGQRMTIVGLGSIGMAIAERASAFGMHVTGVRRQAHATQPSRGVERVFAATQLDHALDGCDVLVVAAPGLASTHGMIGAGQLARLNRGAVLVNVARASLVDDAAMRDALCTGQLRGAVLDVFPQEPLPRDDALWAMPNVVVSPHCAGFRASHWDDVIALFRANLARFRRGDPLHNRVDLAAGY